MQIVKHEQSFADVMSIGKAFAESGMFSDIKSAAQAVVKITAGAEMGIPPFASMSGIHIIQGKPTIGANLMAARVKGSGKYNFKVVEHTDKVCTIDFYEGPEKIGTSTFTDADAKKAGTKNLDKFPRNMLYARAMSNGVKWYAPDIFAGSVYVPEEMPEPEIVDAVATVMPDPKPDPLPEWLEALSQCTSVPQLKEFKAIVPPDVIKMPSFKEAATALFLELSKQPTE